ncbi:PAS domain S-box protein [Natrarchaeobaculum aegyptiacum]|uniref:Hybrid sensor histidine kinase/response regulator n=1 Tax=Natrarchaeobaculum aegyptiacum TaxID=745377 RepID=A0A2Z2HVP1_9EURY|nr:PAS domain S-box protein [Natrarchaeobaculum aegyptiacum]ARS91282.1 hybrid sensor histidine kinase/response regulator [Natrarchaeobaculum aegyptiacum]
MTPFHSSVRRTETPIDSLPDDRSGFVEAPTVLLVDDDEAFIQLVADYLEDEHGFETVTVTCPAAALDHLEDDGRADCVVSDYRMPETDGLAFLEMITEAYPNLPFVMFAGQGSEAVASRAIRQGADDYLQKDTGEARYDLLANRIRHCVTIARQRRQLDELYDAIEDAGHAILVTDGAGKITYANPTMSDLSGYDESELLGETPALLNSGEHDEGFYEQLWETIRDGDIWHGEVVNERKDGTRYVIDQTIAPITDGRSTDGYVAINRDVTDRVERERDLRRFRKAVERAGHAIMITDADGRIEYVNPAFESQTGYDSREVIGETPAILESGVHDQSFYDDLWATIADGDVWHGEVVNERKNGTRFIIDQTISPITTEGGTIDGYVAINRDVTERKEREQELERFRSAVKYAGHGVVITDENATIEYVNDAFEEITGYTASEVVGETPALLKSGEHDDEFYRDLWETILDGEVWHGEVINERKDGSHFAVDQTIAPITDGDGAIDGYVAINRDVSQLKAYRAELEAQNERLTQYGETVAHDLRNPLTLLEADLENLTHVVKATDGDVDPETVLEACSNLSETLERMRNLIDDLLTMAEQGQLVLDPEPVSLRAVAEEAWRQVDSDDASLSVTETTVEADPDRLRELLSNLFRNAVEHAGPDVDVRVGPLERVAGFYVEDDGPGIDPDDRAVVLERGYTTDESGTGFGLAIVDQIADAHGLTVSVAEGSAGGARFEFSPDDAHERN